MKTNHMRKQYYFILLLLVSIVLSSCKTRFRISVKEPAVVKIPDEVIHLGIVNNVTNENSPDKVIGQMLGSEQINGNVAAAERAMDGVLRALDNSNQLKGQTLDISDSIRMEDGELNWAFIDSVCRTRNMQGLIELIEVRSVSPVGGTILANASGQRSAKLQGSLIVNYHIAQTHESFERWRVNHTYNVPLSGNLSVIDVLGDMQRKREYYRALGFQLGYKAGRLIYPNWVWVNRTFYNKGSRNLKRAKPMISKGNWDIAEKQLLQDVEHPKEKIRGRTLYNLALIKEGQGEVDVAIEYAERAALAGDKLANEYLVKLRQRKRDLERMNE
jgi:hypothetical protein